MRCKHCIFQEISSAAAAASSSKKTGDDDEFRDEKGCQKCRCTRISSIAASTTNGFNGSGGDNYKRKGGSIGNIGFGGEVGSGKGFCGVFSGVSELIAKNKPGKKYASKPTELRGLNITNPIYRLIMETIPVKIEWSEVFGRYLVATRDIKRAELIFQVEPIVAGPTPSYTEKDWICMSCFRVTKKSSMVRCDDCQWPFCSEGCSEDEIHRELECLVLAKAKVVPDDSYTDHITLMQLLRCLLTKHKDPEGWEKLMTMESHVEGRKHSTSTIWDRWRAEELKFIHETLGLKEFSEEEINFVSGVLSMNAFGSNDVHGVRHRHGSYLYYLGAMAAHDCAPNTDYEVDENQNFNLKAIVDIPKGSQITLSYALPFQGTLLRRDYLKDYFFDCACKRCSDGLEFGSFFSALKCSTCTDGYLLPDHPLAEESPWKCSESLCNGRRSAAEVNTALKDFDTLRESNEFDASDPKDLLKNLEKLERLMELGKPLFHENHFALMGIEFELIQKIQYYIEINKIPLSKWNDKMLTMTRKQIKVGQMIWPGWNDRYGRLLYLLQCGLLNSVVDLQLDRNTAHLTTTTNGMGKSEKENIEESVSVIPSSYDKGGKTSVFVADEESLKILKEVMKVRMEAKNILLTKPRGSYEHSLGIKLKNMMSVEVTEADLVAKVEKLMKLESQW